MATPAEQLALDITTLEQDIEIVFMDLQTKQNALERKRLLQKAFAIVAQDPETKAALEAQLAIMNGQ